MSGRLCVFGEHSDWAGAWASTYPDVPAGRTLVCGLGWAVCVWGGVERRRLLCGLLPLSTTTTCRS